MLDNTQEIILNQIIKQYAWDAKDEESAKTDVEIKKQILKYFDTKINQFYRDNGNKF